MRKSVVAILIVLVLFTALTFSFGCKQEGTSSSILANGSTDSQNNLIASNSGMIRHEVSLNMNNYQAYFNVTKSNLNISERPRFSFSGCLSYAFYDNVKVTVSYRGFSTGGEAPLETETVTLNANGVGAVYIWSASEYYISNITGSIVYWI